MIIAIGLYDGFTALDAIGPYDVFKYLPGAEVVICAEDTGVISDQKDLVHIRVDAAFAEVPHPDVLLVPGGPGTGQYAADGPPIVDWIRQAHPHTSWTTFGVHGRATSRRCRVARRAARHHSLERLRRPGVLWRPPY